MSFADLDAARLLKLPEAGYYIPNFVTAEEEATILSEIKQTPDSRWTVLSRRRLLSLPSQLTGKARDTLIEAPMPPFLTRIVTDHPQLRRIFAGSPHKMPNHCLVNEYQPGQGIFPHEDGPAYYPITATVSLGGHTVLEIFEKNEEGERVVPAKWRILQEPRSLLVTTGAMYADTLHGIAEVNDDKDLDAEHIVNWDLLGDTAPFERGEATRETRISLTFRDVIKVSKLGGALKFMNRK